MITLNLQKKRLRILLATLVIGVASCEKQPESTAQKSAQSAQVKNADVLPYLNDDAFQVEIKSENCTKSVCEKIEILSLKTADQWVNQQLNNHLAFVIQDQINEKEKLSLDQSIETYISRSESWMKEFSLNQPYELDILTQVATQRNQYVLIQFIVNTKQAEVIVKDRGYFMVLDRKQKKVLQLQDVIQKNQINDFERMLQVSYQKWLKAQTSEVRSIAPVNLSWQNQEWFFDGEGIGVHIRANEIVKGGEQLDIYLNHAQTKQVVVPQIFQKMF
ncbi:hypothetical protein [Acinetobacter sp. YH12239]|uniref:hypothetical protein n=1 Tax=Acinetobacter sp. YH12239 TaxID=2601166 RepID=UPI0015D2473A|nr:hypothetical protein [Acinetobacter sp. YH12239]